MTSSKLTTEFQTGIAILAIVIAVLALSFGDALVKANGLTFPLWQMYILRSALAIPVIVIVLYKITEFRIESWLWVSIRSALLSFMWLCYYFALPSMPFSLAAAGFYTSPIIITLLTALLARQQLPLRVWFAIFLGFIGVTLILRPEAAEFKLISLLPLFAALLYASAMVITSLRCKGEDPLILTLALNIALILLGAILGLFSGSEQSYIFGPWTAVNSKVMLLVVVLSLCMVIGSIGAAIAYQKGPPATIAAFDYSYLVFSLIWGLLIFQEMPGPISLLGICIIAIAGILARKQEH